MHATQFSGDTIASEDNSSEAVADLRSGFINFTVEKLVSAFGSMTVTLSR